MSLERMRALLEEAIQQQPDDSVPPGIDELTGGSGGEQEINWGDVTDVVRETLNVENIVRETMDKIQLKSIDEAAKPFSELAEFKVIHEKLDDLGEAITNMLRSAYKEGVITKDALHGRMRRTGQ